MPPDFDKLASLVVGTVKAAQAGLLARVEAMEARLKAVAETPSVPVQGQTGEKGERGADGIGKDGAGVTSLVISAEGRLVAHLTDGRSVDAGPIPVKEGAPGRDADLSKILGLEAEVAALKLELAAQKAAPALDDLLATVQTAIVSEVGKIPAPKDGKDADLEILKQFLIEQVASIPAPRDGKDADPAEIAALVQTEVGKAVAAIPIPTNGADGTSVSLDDVRPLVESAVERAIAEIPRPQDGAKGDPGIPGQDGKSIGLDDVAPLIASEMQKALAAIPAAKDGAPGERGSDGAPGADGTSVTLQDVEPVIVAEIQKAVAAIPRPVDGAPGAKGEDGRIVSVDDVAPLILSEVQKAVSALPAAKDGEPGASVGLADVEPLIVATVAKAVAAIPVPKDGIPGERGIDGTSLSPTDLEPLIHEEVTKAVAALPVAKDGLAGERGERGDRGPEGKSLEVEDVAPLVAAEVTKAVSLIPTPKDGVGALGALIDREGHMILTLSDGTVKDLGLIVGRDGQDVDMAHVTKFIGEELGRWPKPQNGKDGKDGLGFEDLDLVSDERGVFLRFFRGDVTKEFRLPVVTDRGVFSDGRAYVKGDGVTWAGSFWIAQDETSAKPGTGATAWRLAVKRGSDGRQGVQGLNGKDGAAGRDGKDLTQRGPDGSKW